MAVQVVLVEGLLDTEQTEPVQLGQQIGLVWSVGTVGVDLELGSYSLMGRCPLRQGRHGVELRPRSDLYFHPHVPGRRQRFHRGQQPFG